MASKCLLVYAQPILRSTIYSWRNTTVMSYTIVKRFTEKIWWGNLTEVNIELKKAQEQHSWYTVNPIKQPQHFFIEYAQRWSNTNQTIPQISPKRHSKCGILSGITVRCKHHRTCTPHDRSRDPVHVKSEVGGHAHWRDRARVYWRIMGATIRAVSREFTSCPLTEIPWGNIGVAESSERVESLDGSWASWC